tara:strand:- start:15 stop:533 length:519 start_codon:yes stop_codon:yes gene_type:complete
MKKLGEAMHSKIYHYYNLDKLKKIEVKGNYNLKLFKPTLFNLTLHNGSVLLYLFWYVFSLGGYQIFYLFEKETNRIAHYSNVLPKIFKYSFMNKGDLYIANCFTYKDFRGCSLYPFALSYLGGRLNSNVIWGGVSEDNIPSIKGLERAGYKKVAEGYKSRILGVYKLSRSNV